MKRMIFVILAVLMAVLFFSSFLFCGAAVVLDEHLKPGMLAVDDTQLYVTEGASVYIYSLKDFKLKKKFGRSGVGPQEFRLMPAVPLMIHVETGNIVASSVGKVSIFSKDGTFKKELRVTVMGGLAFLPFRDGFVGRGAVLENNILYTTINIFDAQIKKVKEIYRVESPLQQSGNIEVMKQNILYFTYKDSIIFVTGGEGFHIDAVDPNGKKLFSIKQTYKKRKFTGEDKKSFIDFFRRTTKEQYEMLKDRIVFPGYYPEIAYFFVADNKLFVVTWHRKKDQAEFIVFDLKGKLVKQIYLPFQIQDGVRGYPWAIKNGKLYQLVENPDSEEWELHVHNIEL
jgi:hypothetical protein